MEWRFDNKEEVLYKNEKKVIRARRADWLTKQKFYLLEGVRTPVSEKDLTRIKKEGSQDENIWKNIHADYEKLFGKKVPNNRKNNINWIREKIAEEVAKGKKNTEIPQVVPNTPKPEGKLTYEQVMEMDSDGILAQLTELGYDDSDILAFETEDELREALLDELEIEKPE